MKTELKQTYDRQEFLVSSHYFVSKHRKCDLYQYMYLNKLDNHKRIVIEGAGTYIILSQSNLI